MQLNKIMMAAVLSLSAVSVAHANQGQGDILFTGSIVDAPCSIAADSIDQTVELGAISNAALSANTNTGESKPMPFTIQLENCIVTTGTTPASASKVQVKFLGTTSSYDADSLALVGGNAAGAYILLKQADGKKVTVGTPTTLQQFTDGASPALTFTASLKGNGGTAVITPGSFSVPVQFQLAYQ
ncbi:fimbrial protein (plasmid) [Serratia sp. JSRIV001]|uniref:fimbrial protein n=1 Tax=unclassified Serratia (in: enterobacteria) TaxID=2647522 RepID=UPI001CBC0104|nr:MULTISPECIES: fimbrial protein [unclassified Serratia (in: enterobacteria)]UAN45226.1 fimbrial protein [Serratia sp. JSRIV001]UAN48820.1 fimbrial protein [Serratia sp. JSRIV001]UAN50700.1 fimbrial protein [Serratia sp. JSRIV002]UAN54548.1 fimbrial protein [Serratia sp. JSRIV002]UAN56647.1 fimbrial protein [Serratia sp. JSRIV004]